MTKQYEVELYEPVRRYFTELGYHVQAEVNDCDVVAVKGEELTIIELKRSINQTLLIQATKRQRLTESVYLAVFEPPYKRRSRKWRDMCHLLRRLELGLIIVSFVKEVGHIEIIHEPLAFDRKRSMAQSKKTKDKVLLEVAERRGNYNVGGSHQVKIHTAYKEKSIQIACSLERFGPLSPKQLRTLGTGDKTSSILQKNYYDWFERVKHGVYRITEAGLAELQVNQEIAQIYYGLLPEK